MNECWTISYLLWHWTGSTWSALPRRAKHYPSLEAAGVEAMTLGVNRWLIQNIFCTEHDVENAPGTSGAG